MAKTKNAGGIGMSKDKMFHPETKWIDSRLSQAEQNYLLDKQTYAYPLTIKEASGRSNSTPSGKLIVAVDLSQRSDYEITFGSLTLWMNSDFGERGIDTNPVLAYVRGIGDKVDGFKEGDAILCHYNTFRSMVKDYRYGSHEVKEGGLDLFTIDPERVKCILDKDGSPKPVAGHILVKRMEKEVKTLLIVPDSSKKTDMNWFEVDRTNDADKLPYKAGDTVLCYSYADLEIKYMVNRREFSVFIVKTRDVNGFVKSKK